MRDIGIADRQRDLIELAAVALQQLFRDSDPVAHEIAGKGHLHLRSEELAEIGGRDKGPVCCLRQTGGGIVFLNVSECVCHER